MSDVVIEFSDEELDSSITPGEGGATTPENKPEDNKGSNAPANKNEGFDVDDTEDELNKGQGKGNPGTNNPGGTIEDGAGKTNAELAALHGVTEDDIVLAKNMGWTPKDRFRGDPKDWRDPKEFIRITEESAPVMRERLRSLSKQMDSMKSTIPTILKMQTQQYKDTIARLEREKQDLESDLEQAHMLADSKKAAELTQRIIENKLQTKLTEQEMKDLSNNEQLKGLTGNSVVTPAGIDVAREKAWRDEMWPKLTLAQRQIFKEAGDFLALPINGDQTTDQRIAYREERLFGRSNQPSNPVTRTAPSFAPVARPNNTNMPTSGNDGDDELAGWNSMTAEEKQLAIQIIEDQPWFQKRKTDKASAKQWEEYKRSFKKGE